MNRALYTLLFHVALPLILLRLAWRAWRAPAYARRVGERFALGLAPLQPDGIWLHAVSVGESIAAAPLVRELLARYPQLPITITCMTPTGSERIRALFPAEQYAGRIQHCYLPYDLPWTAARFLRQLRPRLAVIMETELWPNFIAACERRAIPVVLANAPLSERPARGYARFARPTAPMLARLQLIAVQSAAEAQRFLQLGARPEAVQVTGSIKFDLQVDAQLLARATACRADWGARPVWIAASTHAGEDEIALAAHRQLLARWPQALLILVPRHPERFNSVYELCQRQGFATCRRSADAQPQATDVLLLGDTMGELLFLYALADVALVGGSLVANGGHNLLEPAALGKPVLSGPHLFNFLEISSQLREAGALREVQDADSLAREVAQLWQSRDDWQAMSEAGLAVLRRNQGALARLLGGIQRLLP